MFNMQNMQDGTSYALALVRLWTYLVAVLLSQLFCFRLEMHNTPSPASSHCVCVDLMQMNLETSFDIRCILCLQTVYWFPLQFSLPLQFLMQTRLQYI